MNKVNLKAPFPWFGGKSRVAGQVWRRFGDVKNYVEPFAGSLAVLLARPTTPKVETVNDADCYLANFWRALSKEPDKVAEYADWPVNEADLAARRTYLVNRRDFVARMKTDPEYYSCKIAGWWVWGVSQSIGHTWCGIEHRQRMPDEIPHLGTKGNGVHRSSVSCSNNVYSYFQILSKRLRRVRVCCGSWQRVLSTSVTTTHGITAIFLDPPYEGCEDVYSSDKFSFREVEEWAYQNGNDADLRIALCGHNLEPPEGWEVYKWKGHQGYSTKSQNRHRETIVFSPHCLKCEQKELFQEVGVIDNENEVVNL